MTSPIADSVLAATQRLVQQALSGQWQEVPKTIAERRALLDTLTAGASPQDQPWLAALRQAMAESDAVVASLTPRPLAVPASAAQATDSAQDPSAVDSVMNMIRAGQTE